MKPKDIGERMLNWAESRMPVLAEVRRELSKKKPLKGLKVGMALHVEAKTGVLVRALRDAGAEIAIAGCNPLSTKDEVAEALAEEGNFVYAKRGESEQEYYRNLEKVLSHAPDLIIDDGGDLTVLAHEKHPEFERLIGGCEETTTGVMRLRAMEKDGALKIPVIAVNDTPAKRLFDNRFGTAESTLQAIMSITNTLIAGKCVVVVGYGYVGRGIASRARGLGANVIVVETDPIRALEAAMDGFRVGSMKEAVRDGDIFITATGNVNVIRPEHMQKMRDGAILANAGHFNVEIDLKGLEKLATSEREIIEDVKEFKLRNGKRLYLLTEGRLVNLAGKRSLGHPIEIMDMSFSLQALCTVYLAKHGTELEPKVYQVPEEIDKKVAKLKLRSLKIKMEKLTAEQKNYLKSWKFGT
ncbi:MAG: adenosylhomocysteinase [Candidatus Hadarchaeales archaeon]